MTSNTVDPTWLRPKFQQDPIIFQQMTIDYYEGSERQGLMGPDESMAPVARMFGVTREGHSILCHVHGFHPYFYVYNGQEPNLVNLDAFCDQLDELCKAKSSRVASLPRHILRVEYVSAKSVYGYSGSSGQHFLKIVVCVPEIMPDAIELFANDKLESMGVYFPGQADDCGHQMFETNIEYVMRFMVDNGIYGCSWIELPFGKFKLRKHDEYSSTCQIECDINFKDFIAHPPEGIWTDVAPLRILSLDIECSVRGTIFPKPEWDQVIQIANVVVRHGHKEPFVRCIFTLRSCAPIEGATVRSFDTEAEMLLEWAKFLVQIDPDIITGYNILNFDIRYLMERAKVLKIGRFPYLGRIHTSETKILYKTTNCKRSEDLKYNVIIVEGRILIDMMSVIRRYHKLRPYTLNHVSKHFLGEQKEDVHFTMITGLFNGNKETRKRLAVYCLKDADLPLKLLDHLNLITQFMESARVSGVPFSYLLTREVNTKTIYQFLREANRNNYLLPITPSLDSKKQLEKSTVLSPMTAYYDNCNVASDIISIIIEKNICYTSLLSRNTIHKYQLDEDEFIKTPAGSYFKKEDDSFKTVVPQMLKSLLGARKRTEEELKSETSPSKRIMLEGRQLALNTSANSIYHGIIWHG